MRLAIDYLLRKAYNLFGLTLSPLHLSKPFSSYSKCLSEASGYSDHLIATSVLNKTVDLIENSSYQYERDGVLFAERPSFLPIRHLFASICTSNTVIYDFGGAFGGTFYSNIDLLDKISSYIIIEQDAYVSISQCNSLVHDQRLKFVSEDDLFMQNHNSNIDTILILSSVLQYIPNNMKTLDQLLKISPKWIIIDRTPITRHATAFTNTWHLQYCNNHYSVGHKCTIPFAFVSKQDLLDVLTNYSEVLCWTNLFDSSDQHGLLFLAKGI